MEVRFLNEKGGAVEEISALVYVFFNLTRAERVLWFEGGMEKIAIWYANEETGSWEICPTLFVNESRDNGTSDRLACLAPGSGYYAIGHGDVDGLLFKPSAGDNGKAVESASKFIPQ